MAALAQPQPNVLHDLSLSRSLSRTASYYAPAPDAVTAATSRDVGQLVFYGMYPHRIEDQCPLVATTRRQRTRRFTHHSMLDPILQAVAQTAGSQQGPSKRRGLMLRLRGIPQRRLAPIVDVIVLVLFRVRRSQAYMLQRVRHLRGVVVRVQRAYRRYRLRRDLKIAAILRIWEAEEKAGRKKARHGFQLRTLKYPNRQAQYVESADQLLDDYLSQWVPRDAKVAAAKATHRRHAHQFVLRWRAWRVEGKGEPPRFTFVPHAVSIEKLRKVVACSLRSQQLAKIRRSTALAVAATLASLCACAAASSACYERVTGSPRSPLHVSFSLNPLPASPTWRPLSSETPTRRHSTTSSSQSPSTAAPTPPSALLACLLEDSVSISNAKLSPSASGQGIAKLSSLRTCKRQQTADSKEQASPSSSPTFLQLLTRSMSLPKYVEQRGMWLVREADQSSITQHK